MKGVETDPDKASRPDWQSSNADYNAGLCRSLALHLTSLGDPGSSKSKLAENWLAADESGSPPALSILRTLFDLSAFETSVLALCAAYELDSAIAGSSGDVVDGRSRPWPTFQLALELFEGGSWAAATASGTLRYWRLVELKRAFGSPLVSSPIQCDERILDFIKGLNQIDERLGVLLTLHPVGGGPGDAAAADGIARMWRSEASTSPMILVGANASMRLATAAAAAESCGRRLFRVEAAMLPSAPVDLDLLARLWRREASLSPCVLFVELGSDGAADDAAVRRFVARVGPGVAVAVGVEGRSPRLAEDYACIAVSSPNASVQEAAWNAELGRGREAIAHRLAGTFDFDLETIRRIAAVESASGGDEAVWRASSMTIRPGLDALAQRIEPRAAWDDLVVPDTQQALLRQIIDQVRLRRRVHDDWGYGARLSRGLGVTALFSGESGTGKTMAAEVIAGELGVDLYRIDLSSIVDKYIGETEKNLRRLFDAAERGGTMLLFDEADALFGKRSEIKDSHDRYANIEVNYLLQRLESFTGLAVLATNMKSSLDTAFLRRLRFVVQFPYPGSTEREVLWRRTFPPDVPLEPLRYEQLARINLTGGNIAAVSINATFLAAAEPSSVGMRHVLQAARAEMTKLNRPINESDFVA